MKSNINVIDLDNTLLPYDSFGKYIFIFLGHYRSSLSILFLIILKKIRIINSSTFKKKVIKTARQVENYHKIMKKFGNELCKEFDGSIIELIRQYENEHSINILCTASPEDYVKYIANYLNWKYLATTLDENTGFLLHMYGNEKLKAIRRKFPADHYFYNFSVSDSYSDKTLLSQFKHSKLIG